MFQWRQLVGAGKKYLLKKNSKSWLTSWTAVKTTFQLKTTDPNQSGPKTNQGPTMKAFANWCTNIICFFECYCLLSDSLIFGHLFWFWKNDIVFSFWRWEFVDNFLISKGNESPVVLIGELSSPLFWPKQSILVYKLNIGLHKHMLYTNIHVELINKLQIILKYFQTYTNIYLIKKKKKL